MARCKLSMTRQRRIMLEELRGVTSHPTADEVYEMVRARLPRISLGTVYRNLEILSDCGEIRRLHVGGTQMRFDGNPAAHSHIRCEYCGRVADIAFEPAVEFANVVRDATDFQVSGYHLEFVGICPDCLASDEQ